MARKENVTNNFDRLFNLLDEEKKIEVILASEDFKGRDLRKYTEPKDTVSLKDMDGRVIDVAGWCFYTTPDRTDLDKRKMRITFKDKDGNYFSTASNKFVNDFASIIRDLKEDEESVAEFQIKIEVKTNNDASITWFECELY